MNGPEQTPLLLAQRAYRATEPSVAEVQAGVRRARLSLRRPRRSRALLGKALIGVVLAMGGLAYAKPNALGELVDAALSRTPKGGASPAGAASAKPALPAAAALALPGGRSEPGAPSAPNAPSSLSASSAPNPASAAPLLSSPAASSNAAPAADAAAAGVGQPPPVGSRAQHADKRPSQPPRSNGGQAASKWSRVGKALAQGDEQAALDALDALARSDDPSTRDKAELGRAQLLLARGDRDQACTIARSLTERQAGNRIERQALALLKSCAR